MVDEPANELMEFFGAKDCSPYVFLPRGARLEAHQGGKHKLTPASDDELEAWVWDFVRAPGLLLKNDGPAPVAIHWEAPLQDLAEKRVMTLAPGEAKAFDTFKGHTLVWREALPEGTFGSGPLLARAVVTDAAVAEGGFVLSALRAGEGDTEALQHTEEEVAKWRGRLRTNMARIRQNERQPPTVPAFTEVGFKHMKMPKELHDRLTQFYAAREASRVDEGWHVSWCWCWCWCLGVCVCRGLITHTYAHPFVTHTHKPLNIQRDDLHVNFYRVMTTIVHADPATKQAVIDQVRPILDDWIGHVDTLDHTSTYGIRRYYNGSECVGMGVVWCVHAPTGRANNRPTNRPDLPLSQPPNLPTQKGSATTWTSGRRTSSRPSSTWGRTWTRPGSCTSWTTRAAAILSTWTSGTVRSSGGVGTRLCVLGSGGGGVCVSA